MERSVAQASKPNLQRKDKTSLRDFLNVIFRHKRKICIFFVVVVLAVTIWTYLTAKVYQSNAKILILIGRESVSVDPSVVGPTTGLTQSRENQVNSELVIIRSRILAEKVVDKIGVENFFKKPGETPSPSPSAGGGNQAEGGVLVSLDLTPGLTLREKAINHFMKNLYVEVERKSHIINLNYDGFDPQVAQNALNSLLDFYLQYHITVHRTQVSPQFFEDQAKNLTKTLNGKEEELEKMQNEFGLFSVLDQKKELIAAIAGLQAEISGATSEIRSSQARIASLQMLLKGTGPVRMNGLQSLPLRLETETYQSIHAQIQGDLSSGTFFQLQIANEITRQESLAARVNSLNEELAGRRQELATLASREILLQRLQREVEILNGEYREYRNGLQRAKISTALDIDSISNVSIVQRATAPIGPIRPKKIFNILMGILCGLLGGILLAFFIEYIDDSMKTNTEITKRLNLPVLASLGSLRVPAKFDALQDTGKETQEPSRYTGIEDKLIPLYHNLSSELLEERKGKTIQFIGCNPGEGASTLIREFAKLTALRFHKKTLLLDINVKKATQCKYFGIEAEKGIKEAIDEGADLQNALNQVGDSSLYISQISLSASPSALLDSPEFNERFKELKDDFDYIFIDSPPSVTSPDGMALCRKVDGAVIVIEAEKTRWQVVANLIETIKKQQGVIFGSVLNKMQFHIPRFIYKRLL